ncbi:MAG: hypothetical protein OJF50_001903 [Nitrospira sp.]|nr:hypothetical protein [Nitrospira sp.]
MNVTWCRFSTLNNDLSWTLPTCFVQLLMGYQNLCHHGGPFDEYVYKRMIADDTV